MATSSRLKAHRDRAPEMNAAHEAEIDPEEMPDEDEDEEDCSEAGDKKGKPYMTESEANAAIAAARAEGFAEATARANTVLASEHYAGRETLATTLLATELSADSIVAALAAAPKAAAPVADAGEDDEAARAEMRDRLAAEQPGPTGQAAEDEPEADNSLVANMKARFGLKD